eukprot:gnl/TRDRNA2_/TRDRNA2_80916_c0_seq1.p1 gnl/TRDRNA2_/TRDRNA2_80916_c0~~gnl/TRDRNA2_/TRDRNA2_80916_c0_seq1.p1  ORF type:complete len:233 (+),score=32.96 gnl/TRDRNA2_/TRDRNA2_80916_c0_seq1:86-784(+)
MLYASRRVAFLVGDVADLFLFAFWTILYLPHVIEADKPSFIVICTAVVILGLWNASLPNSMAHPKASIGFAVFNSVCFLCAAYLVAYGWPFQGGPTHLVTVSVLFALLGLVMLVWSYIIYSMVREGGDLEKMSAKAWINIIHHEIIFDVLQIGVQIWLLSRLKFKENEEHFNWKLLADLLNMLSAVADVIVLKGPSALALIVAKPQKTLEVLIKEMDLEDDETKPFATPVPA